MKKHLFVLAAIVFIVSLFQNCSESPKRESQIVTVKGYVQPNSSIDNVMEKYRLRVKINTKQEDATLVGYSLLKNGEWFDCDVYVSPKNPKYTWGYNWSTVIEGESVFFEY
ncbi:MAG: hypothetical protein ACK5KT_03835 [Dysgonomonas sp.]